MVNSINSLSLITVTFNFLDVTVIKDNELIEFNWYHNFSTFSGRYLNFWSQHPVSQKIGQHRGID